MKWSVAKSHCKSLSLGGSNDWRLPTISELRTLIRGCPATQTGGACRVTDECLNSRCNGGNCGCDNTSGECLWASQMLGVGACDGSWSSSAVADIGSAAWYVNFGTGSVGTSHAGDDYGDAPARCVR